MLCVLLSFDTSRPQSFALRQPDYRTPRPLQFWRKKVYKPTGRIGNGTLKRAGSLSGHDLES